MPIYETEADRRNAAETLARIVPRLGCRVEEMPPGAPFNYQLHFDDGSICVEIKRRNGVVGKPPMDRTIWLSLHKRTTAAEMGLPLWFIVSADNGDFIWSDQGEQFPIHRTGRHGRPTELVLQIPVSAFIAVE
jgi:hypothetical protein